MSYGTSDLVEAVLGRELTAYETAVLPYIMDAVDSYIDDETGTSFTETTETRYFDGQIYVNDRGRILSIPAVKTITSVGTVDDELVASESYNEGTDYVLGPNNSEIKTYIEWRGLVPGGIKNIAITGTWGGVLPSDITYLSAYLTAKYLNAQTYAADGVSGPVTKETLEGYSREYAGSNSDGLNINFFADGITVGILSKYKSTDIFL